MNEHQGQREGRQGQSREGGKPQPDSRRFVYPPWRGTHDRVVCAHEHPEGVKATPVVARPGLARPAMLERDRTSSAVLLCTGMHEGPCQWPSGQLAGDLDEAREREITELAMRAAASLGR